MLEVKSDFGEIPYFPISRHYKQLFGEKVFKIPVSIAEDCPNRRGLKGMKTCIFCDEWGSFAYPQSQSNALETQIKTHREKVASRFNAKKFLVYFQAYTTTFTQVKKLREAFEVALSYPDVVGIVVGTRPDCLSESLFDLFNETVEKTFMAVELGVQSFDNRQLEWMRRGHTAEQSIRGLIKMKKKTSNVQVGIHLMFGWPGETEEDIRKSAALCNELEIDDVKLHNLHVLKNTPLADLHAQGEFQPIEWDDYCHLVGVFLQNLSPKIAVHRLVALASRWDELVAPQWTRHKMTNYQYMITYLQKNNIYQGQLYS